MNTTASPENASIEALLSQITDEFLQRLDAGEQPDIEEYVQRYPTLADVLRQVLPALSVLRQPPSGGEAPADGLVSGVLGDFRIVREVGRGGMGVVYEAEQISLGRRVALKVLPFAATMDARQLQRFHNEARAAAGLHQEHIVPVHAVGCERGIHFYAMQFIDGRTLAELIEQQRSPGGGAANEPTAAYSPQQGGGDATVETVEVRAEHTPPPGAGATSGPVGDGAYFRRVAEWGEQAAEALEYAHSVGIVHRDIKPANLMVDAHGKLWVTDFGLARTAGDSGLTMTGDLLGTLRYMSPEQALAKHGLVDHRTDVYSLGVTLYELLTLRPAVDGKDRQEILQRIAFEEPAAPRSLNRAIPAELETIVLKAMAKELAERYATAKELADDLRRWLFDQPIQARRPTAVMRLRKWSHRHRQIVNLTGGFLALAVIALTAGIGLIWHERNKTEAAYEAEVRQRERAEARSRLALQAADDMYTDVAQKWLADQPALEPLQRDFLLKALAVYEELSREEGTDVELTFKVALAQDRVGGIHRQLGEHTRAEVAERQAVAILERLTADSPENERYRRQLSTTLSHLAWILDSTDHVDEAESVLRRGLEVAALDAASAKSPRDCELMGDMHHSLAEILRQGGRMAEGEAEARQARLLLEKAMKGGPSRHLLDSLAGTLSSCAYFAVARGEGEEARELVEQAIQRAKRALADKPHGLQERIRLGSLYEQLGGIFVGLLREPEALEATRKSIPIMEGVVKDYPNTPSVQRKAALCWANLGHRLQSDWSNRKPQDWEAAYRRAMELQEKVAASPNATPADYSALGETLANLAKIHSQRFENRETLRLLERAIHNQKIALRANPRNPYYHDYLVQHRLERVGLLATSTSFAEVADAIDELIPDCQRKYVNLAGIIHHCLNNTYGINIHERERERFQSQIREVYRRARACATQAQKDQIELVFVKGALAACLIDHSASAADRAEGISLLEETVKTQPGSWQNWCTLGRGYYRSRNYRAAVEALEKASQLPGGANAWNYLILAPAYWQLGEKDTARRRFQQATEWMDRTGSQLGSELRRFRSEAVVVMGVEDDYLQDELRRAKDDPPRLVNVGIELYQKGRRDEAIAAFRQAIRINKDLVQAHTALAIALSDKGLLDEAIAELREVIRINKDELLAHVSLGELLERKGLYTEALVHARRGHELGSRNPQWTHRTTKLLANCERLVELDKKLPAILSGQKQPADTKECLLLAKMCLRQKRYAAVTRFCSEAFVAEPKLIEDPAAGHRYNASCAAALAGCGQGIDTDKLDSKERTRLRRQALDWLRADLALWDRLLEKGPAKARPVVAQKMQHWLKDSDLAGVRNADELNRLSESERRDWQQLWRDVEALRQRAASTASPGIKEPNSTKESPTPKP